MRPSSTSSRPPIAAAIANFSSADIAAEPRLALALALAFAFTLALALVPVPDLPEFVFWTTDGGAVAATASSAQAARSMRAAPSVIFFIAFPPLFLLRNETG